MAKKETDGRKKIIRAETIQGIFAVLFFSFGLALIFAAFGKAGLVGDKLYRLLRFITGVGYFVLPFLCFFLTAGFLRARSGLFPLKKTAGACILFLGGLGIIDLIFPTQGGIIGTSVQTPLVQLFDVYMSLVILAAIFIISLLIVFDASIPVGCIGTWWRNLRNKPRREPEVSGLASEEPELYQKIETETEQKEDLKGLDRQEKKLKERPTQKDEMPIKPTSRFHAGAYTPPPLSLLETDRGKPGVGDIKANANIIKRTLQNFGIEVEMDEISIGPAVTRYALKPAESVRLSKIVALQRELELALAAHPIRIEAPIPGKSLVGIEIPNIVKATVGLATMLGSQEFASSDKPLLISLGKDLSGKTHFANLPKMPHLLIAGATGSGKTCAKDTYIFSEKGILTFEELCPLSLNSEMNYSLRVATRDGVETTSKNYNNGICDFYKITTTEGLSIEVTEEHPLWVMKDGAMHWQNGGGTQIGEYVAISRGVKLFGGEKQINFTPALNKTNKAREIKTPTQMTPKLGLFMGLLTADGGLTIKNRVVYTQANKEVLHIYMTLLKDLFGITAPIVAKSGASNKTKDVVVNSRHLKDFLTHLGVKPVGAREKEVPKSIRQSEPEIIKSFVQGLIRNDGHISPLQGLEITLATEKLLKQLQIILLNFGIVSSIHVKKVKNYKENSYWRLAVYGAEFVTYAREIGFLTDEERGKAKLLLALHRNTNKNIIPTLKPILKKLCLMYRGTFARLTNKGWNYQQNTLVPKYAFKSLASYNSGIRNPSYEALEKILTFYGPLADSDDYKKVAKISEDNFYWAKVAKIEKTAGEGYDFEVPGSNSFVGNGFVNHNSVTIHTIITSLLFRNGPEDLKFILIDPKRVELTLYNNIPHLLTPVITDAKKAILSLKWAAKEMERRYDMLESESVRDIHSYHKNIVEPEYRAFHAVAKTEPAPEKETENKSSTFLSGLEHRRKDSINTHSSPKQNAMYSEKVLDKLPERMPYIVIVIDELADMMSIYPRELEAAIIRLAQMSRAVGIHLILSTQRPSVNIITGLIKANIPSRIALQVASQIDSRTILDTGGAEKLLGAGDMLFLSSEMAKPIRLQSAFISETEVKKVTAYLNKIYADELPYELHLGGEENGNSIFENNATAEEEIDDNLYEEAREYVLHAGKASTSYLQRKLRIGYSRAARIMDMLEERNVIGPADGSKPREVIRTSPAPTETETEETI